MLGKKVINQSLIYGLASLLINGSNFFLIPLYTHYLATAEYGMLSSVTVFSTFTTAFLGFGLNGAVTRFYFDYQSDDFKKFLFSVFSFQVITAAIVVVIFIAFNGLFLDKIFNNVPYNPYLKYGILIGFTGIFSTIPLAFLQAQSKALLYRTFTSSSFIILTACMIIFIVINQEGAIGGIKASLIANSLMAMAYSLFLIRHSTFNFSTTYMKAALYFSLPLMVYVIFGTLTEISSKYFIERYISLSQLGIFNVAQQIAAIITLLTSAINMAWVPLFYAEASRDEQTPLFSMFANFFIFFLVLAGFSLSLLSPEVVLLLMSPGYNEASLYIPYLILAYVIGNGYWLLLINPLAFSKKTIYTPFLTILSGSLSVGLNIYLIPRFGLLGACISTCVSYGILIFVTYYIFKKHSAVRYNFKTINSMVAAGAILYIGSRLFSFELLWVSVLFKACLIMLYCIILQYLKIYSFNELKLFFEITI